MRVLVVSEEGEGLSLAHHIKMEGRNNVSFLTSSDSPLGSGIVDRLDASTPLGARDLIILDSDSFTVTATTLRDQGERILGPYQWTSLMHADTTYMRDLITTAGLPYSDSLDGINLYVTGWFNARSFIHAYSSLVYRRFMSSGRGPDVAFTGLVTNFQPTTERIRKEVLAKLAPLLKRANFIGTLHTHLVIRNDSYSVKSLSAQFVHPLTLSLLENVNTRITRALITFFDETIAASTFIDPWVAGCMLSIPNFPYSKAPSTPLTGLRPANLRHIWLTDALRNKEGWRTSGTTGKVGYITARGASITEAVKRIYRTIGNLDIKDVQYRDDIGLGLVELLSKLRDTGWLHSDSVKQKEEDPCVWAGKKRGRRV